MYEFLPTYLIVYLLVRYPGKRIYLEVDIALSARLQEEFKVLYWELLFGT
jgi:hypothetical protein